MKNLATNFFNLKQKLIAFAFFISIPAMSFGQSNYVTSINALHDHGQTFLTWDHNSIDANAIFRIYRATKQITNANSALTVDIGSLQPIGYVKHGSSKNSRYQSAYVNEGCIGANPDFLFHIPSGVLTVSQELYVITADISGPYFYAVTASIGINEYTTMNPGVTSLSSAVNETVGETMMVLQETITKSGKQIKVYTQFVSTLQNAGIYSNIYPGYPRMVGNPIDPTIKKYGYLPFNVAIRNNGLGNLHALRIFLHGGGGNFLRLPVGNDNLLGSATVGLDDWLPNSSSDYANTAWFGYSENFDVYNTPTQKPAPGEIVYLYTIHRILYTIDNILSNDATYLGFDVNPNRIILKGTSAGAGGCTILSMIEPSKFAVTEVEVAPYDLSFTYDQNYTDWNCGGSKRDKKEYQFGVVTPCPFATELTTDFPWQAGLGSALTVYQVANSGFMAQFNLDHLRSLPIIWAVNGSRDNVTGWEEKSGNPGTPNGAYKNFDTYKVGGYFYWDTRDHGGTPAMTNKFNPSDWQSNLSLSKYAKNVAYPAFSKPSAGCTDACSWSYGTGDTGGEVWGDGTPKYDGSEYGTINGYLDWDDPSATDLTSSFTITLHTKAVSINGGTVIQTPPTYCYSAVTFKRLQNFIYTGCPKVIQIDITDLNTLVTTSSLMCLQGGFITLPCVKIVNGNGTKVKITKRTNLACVCDGYGHGGGGRIGDTIYSVEDNIFSIYPNPASDHLNVLITGNGEVNLKIFNSIGQIVSTSRIENVIEETNLNLDVSSLLPGIYFAKCEINGQTIMKEFTITR